MRKDFLRIVYFLWMIDRINICSIFFYLIILPTKSKHQYTMNRYLKQIIVLSLASFSMVCHANDSDNVKTIIMGGAISRVL